MGTQGNFILTIMCWWSLFLPKDSGCSKSVKCTLLWSRVRILPIVGFSLIWFSLPSLSSIRSIHKNKLGFVSVGCNILSTAMYCLNLSPEVALNLFDEHHLASVPRFKSFWKTTQWEKLHKIEILGLRSRRFFISCHDGRGFEYCQET